MKDKIITFIFLIFIFGFSVIGILLKDKEISLSERRKLQIFPSFDFTDEYVTKLDKYFLDHFPLRENFRSIKAIFNYKVLNRLDNNNIYLKDKYIFKSEYPTNKKSISKFVDRINIFKEGLSNHNKVFIMIIPDKNYYLDDTNFLNIDYDYIYNEVGKIKANFIDIRDIMSLSDYYETDTHWKQEKLDKVIKRMSSVMNFQYNDYEYKENVYDNFYGVYYGESAINRKPEKLIYLSSNIFDNLRVEYLENKSLFSIYNLNKLEGLDGYEVYLDGASSFIEIYNDNASTNRELIIFRDSFGSSITPLLTPYYRKITLIDNRYIGSKDYLNLVDFTNQDVLFMYSTLIVNNSSSLKG